MNWLRRQVRATAAQFGLLRVSECGVSAVEFSLLAPFLVIGTFSTVDAGMAIYEKMMISQVLRAGAHSAIAADNEATVLGILQATADENFTVAQGTPSGDELAVNVASYCVCPEATGTQVTCSTTCTLGVSPYQFYTLDANKTFDGVILPSFTLSGSIDVMSQ